MNLEILQKNTQIKQIKIVEDVIKLLNKYVEKGAEKSY